MKTDVIQVLLIDDDEDDYIITSELLEDSQHTSFTLDWVDNYQDAWQAIEADAHDVYLIDYRLDRYNGLEIVQQAVAHKCKKPLILLTGQGDHEIEQQALELGASDYLVKGQFSNDLLERSIIYAIKNKNTLNSLEESESRYRAVIESQQELICRFTPDMILTFVNGAYGQYFQKSAEELIGRSWLELIPENQHTEAQNHVASLLHSRQPVTHEWKGLAADGSIRWQQWTDQVILTETDASEVLEIQSVGVDITERKRAELALAEALMKERELNELKSRFVAMASHEFRTPLAKIIGIASFLEMTEDKIGREKRIERLQKIQKAGHEMTSLIDDVLIYGKSEADKLEFSPEPIDLIQFITVQIEEIRLGMNQSYELVFNHHVPQLMIHADEKLLRQMINNLLTNAIKYSPAHSTVTVAVEQLDAAVRLTVQDQGIGIPQMDQQRLFEPFHRATNVRDISGTGLGLTITAKAVELHGGQITFESQEERGTRFTITLPMHSN